MTLELGGGRAGPRPGTRILIWCGPTSGGIHVVGLSLWHHAILTAVRSGFEKLLVVVPGSAETVANAFAGDPRFEGRTLDVVLATEGWPGRLDAGSGRWVVLQDRWIVDSALLEALAQSEEGVVAASSDGPFAADTGVVARWARSGWRPSHPPLVPIESRYPKPLPYVRVDGAADVAAAEDALFRSLARSDANFFSRNVDRVLSRAISRRLVRTGISPNQITMVSVTLGVVGALSLLHPSYGAGVLGTFLFLLSTILDGCDGEIARLKFQESRLGAKLDLVGDNIVHAFLFPSIAGRFWITGHGEPYLVFGAITLAGAVATWLVVWRTILRPDPSPRAVALFDAFANREFAYGLFVLGLAGRLEWFVWLMTIGIWVFPLGLLLLDRIPGRIRHS